MMEESNETNLPLGIWLVTAGLDTGLGCWQLRHPAAAAAAAGSALVREGHDAEHVRASNPATWSLHSWAH